MHQVSKALYFSDNNKILFFLLKISKFFSSHLFGNRFSKLFNSPPLWKVAVQPHWDADGNPLIAGFNKVNYSVYPRSVFLMNWEELPNVTMCDRTPSPVYCLLSSEPPFVCFGALCFAYLPYFAYYSSLYGFVPPEPV